MKCPGVHAGRSVAFGIFDEEQGTEEVVIIAEVDSEDTAEQQRIADALRAHITKNSAIALRHVKVVGPKWILKTSSGKTARSANKEKFLRSWRTLNNSSFSTLKTQLELQKNYYYSIEIKKQPDFPAVFLFCKLSACGQSLLKGAVENIFLFLGSIGLGSLHLVCFFSVGPVESFLPCHLEHSQLGFLAGFFLYFAFKFIFPGAALARLSYFPSWQA